MIRGSWFSLTKNVVWTDRMVLSAVGTIEEKQRSIVSRYSGSGSVMIWARLFYYGKSRVAFLNCYPNSLPYYSTLWNYLFEFGTLTHRINWKFQKDNAPIHVSAATGQWFSDRLVDVISWSAQFPDLDPIENTWGVLDSAPYSNSKLYETVESVKLAIMKKLFLLANALLQ